MTGEGSMHAPHGLAGARAAPTSSMFVSTFVVPRYLVVTGTSLYAKFVATDGESA